MVAIILPSFYWLFILTMFKMLSGLDRPKHGFVFFYSFKLTLTCLIFSRPELKDFRSAQQKIKKLEHTLRKHKYRYCRYIKMFLFFLVLEIQLYFRCLNQPTWSKFLAMLGIYVVWNSTFLARIKLKFLGNEWFQALYLFLSPPCNLHRWAQK